MRLFWIDAAPPGYREERRKNNFFYKPTLNSLVFTTSSPDSIAVAAKTGGKEMLSNLEPVNFFFFLNATDFFFGKLDSASEFRPLYPLKIVLIVAPPSSPPPNIR